MKANKMKINVLDKGYIELIETMGSDNLIAETARVSTQSKGKNNEALIRRLMRDRHTSPFEFGELHIEIKAPVFVFRQMFRHRTFNLNEQSLRYSESECEFYVPSIERMQSQSVDNRQGSGEMLSEREAQYCYDVLRGSQRQAETSYRRLLQLGLTRELARNVLSFDLYASARIKCDVHNWLHFLKLRTDSHAQWEIQQYANAIEQIIEEKFPITYNAWVDYVKEAVTFSKQEMKWIKEYFNEDRCFDGEHNSANEKELNQFLEKLKC